MASTTATTLDDFDCRTTDATAASTATLKTEDDTTTNSPTNGPASGLRAFFEHRMRKHDPPPPTLHTSSSSAPSQEASLMLTGATLDEESAPLVPSTHKRKKPAAAADGGDDHDDHDDHDEHTEQHQHTEQQQHTASATYGGSGGSGGGASGGNGGAAAADSASKHHKSNDTGKAGGESDQHYTKMLQTQSLARERLDATNKNVESLENTNKNVESLEKQLSTSKIENQRTSKLLKISKRQTESVQSLLSVAQEMTRVDNVRAVIQAGIIATLTSTVKMLEDTIAVQKDTFDMSRDEHKDKLQTIRDKVDELRYVDEFGLSATKGVPFCPITRSDLHPKQTVVMLRATCNCNCMVAYDSAGPLIQASLNEEVVKCILCNTTVDDVVATTTEQASKIFAWRCVEDVTECNNLEQVYTLHTKKVEEDKAEECQHNTRELRNSIVAIRSLLPK
jgi:hypothetical protein